MKKGGEERGERRGEDDDGKIEKDEEEQHELPTQVSHARRLVNLGLTHTQQHISCTGQQRSHKNGAVGKVHGTTILRCITYSNGVMVMARICFPV